jgi:hypothetical protein
MSRRLGGGDGDGYSVTNTGAQVSQTDNASV